MLLANVLQTVLVAVAFVETHFVVENFKNLEKE